MIPNHPPWPEKPIPKRWGGFWQKLWDFINESQVIDGENLTWEETPTGRRPVVTPPKIKPVTNPYIVNDHIPFPPNTKIADFNGKPVDGFDGITIRVANNLRFATDSFADNTVLQGDTPSQQFLIDLAGNTAPSYVYTGNLLVIQKKELVQDVYDFTYNVDGVLVSMTFVATQSAGFVVSPTTWV